MACVCLYLQLHQPFRLRRYSVFDTDPHYFDDLRNAETCRGVAQRSYLPAGRILLRLLEQLGDRLRLALSFSGTVLDQFEAFAPEVTDLYQRLVQTGLVDVLAEPYHHSLAALYSAEEFKAQVALHRRRVEGVFGVTPRVLRNTELIYHGRLARLIEATGHSGVLVEATERELAGRPAGRVYAASAAPELRLLPRHTRLSDDIAHRFNDRSWSGWPLTAEKLAAWVDEAAEEAGNPSSPEEAVIGLFLNLAVFGDRHWADTGILEFLRHIPERILASPRGHRFVTPSELCDRTPAALLEFPVATSWASPERDTSAWLGNAMQVNAMHELYRLEGPVKASDDPAVLEDWRRLTSSDHSYYMSTKYWSEVDVTRESNPYESPYDAYINFMNVLDNIASRVGATGRREL